MSDTPHRPKPPPRDRAGRFRKGASGHPAGRPSGILNEATRTAAVLLGGEAGALTRRAIELALAGDIAALRLCLDRIIAPQREQPVAFAMPAIGEPPDLQGAMAAVTGAAAAGAIAPAQAAALAQALEAHARVIEVTARVEAERLAAQRAEIADRYELRVCVVMAHQLREPFVEEERDGEMRVRCEEMRRIGRAALNTLATIPDTPELVEADRAFIAAHPLPLDRAPRLLGVDMARAWRRLSAYRERRARINPDAQIT